VDRAGYPQFFAPSTQTPGIFIPAFLIPTVDPCGAKTFVTGKFSIFPKYFGKPLADPSPVWYSGFAVERSSKQSGLLPLG
jgi:hypothetical protein